MDSTQSGGGSPSAPPFFLGWNACDLSPEATSGAVDIRGAPDICLGVIGSMEQVCVSHKSLTLNCWPCELTPPVDRSWSIESSCLVLLGLSMANI